METTTKQLRDEAVALKVARYAELVTEVALLEDELSSLTGWTINFDLLKRIIRESD